MDKQIAFTKNGIRVGDRELPLYSGSIHYWRMERENWEKALKNIKNMGFDIVETYIPWAVHEPMRGDYDFGEQDKKKDVDFFLTLCEKTGLYVIVRPGPHINAEMTLFGYPEWLLRDKEIQARSPQGTTVVYPYVTKQFPIPSYASSRLYEETERYFQRLAPLIRKHCYPRGGIIAIQADNETCNFFRDHPYILDYSRESEALFHRMLQEKYTSVDKLNEAYGTDYSEFSHVRMPVGYEAGQSMEPCFDWIEYKEYQILDALKKMVGIIERMDLPIPVFHNCAYQTYTPVSVCRDEEIRGLDVAGMDAYPDPGDTSMLKERIRYLAGSSRLPFVPEFGSGSWFDRGILLTPEEELFGYLYSIMNGLKAVNFYMLAERDRWTGCPVKNNGEIRQNWYDMFASLTKLLKGQELWKYQRSPKILVLKNYEMGRMKALLAVRNRNLYSSNCFIRGTDIPQELFFPEKLPSCMTEDGTGHYGREEWIEKIMEALDECHLEYDISDSFLPEDRLAGYDWIFASSYEFMEPDVQKKLADYAKGKDRHLCIGPVLPKYDRRHYTCGILHGEWEAGRVMLLESPQELKNQITLPKPEYTCEDSQVELSVHESMEERCHLLFAANVTGQKKDVTVSFEGYRKWTGIWNAKDVEGAGNIYISMEPYEIRIWKIRREERYAG
ncbi:MAG: beta-galactosidase [Eubacteriales bacterium]|nr:beta-galactosidase [Eubacteriales bacterium]